MKLFACDKCQQTLYFENNRCVNCGEALAFDPDAARMATFAPGQSLCRNARERDACNWLVTDDGAEFCRSCALSEVIPDLSDAGNERAWRRLESAKRRLLYSLHALRLPVKSRAQDPTGGLAFRFLKGTADAPVMTGHDEGVITLNVDEADVAFRENMREKMGEGYRTVLGHLRHEIGHYYWDRLVRDTAWLEGFRALFGDETRSYEEAIARHYESGPPEDWREYFISAYASMHPWEDWAETWAHYMHLMDTLETAKSHGLTVRSPATEQPGERIATERIEFLDFERLAAGWNALTLALNSLNRSMGLEDAYPFVLSPTVLGKLRFVHELVCAQRVTTPGVSAAA